MEDVQSLLSDLSAEVVEIIEAYIDEPLVDLEDLIEQLVSYRDEISDKFGVNAEFADEELATMLAARSVELLERVATEYDEDQHRLAQAATRYLVDEQDDEEDLDSPIGFDDDKEVFNAVVEAMGHDDLAIY